MLPHHQYVFAKKNRPKAVRFLLFKIFFRDSIQFLDNQAFCPFRRDAFSVFPILYCAPRDAD